MSEFQKPLWLERYWQKLFMRNLVRWQVNRVRNNGIVWETFWNVEYQKSCFWARARQWTELKTVLRTLAKETPHLWHSRLVVWRVSRGGNVGTTTGLLTRDTIIRGRNGVLQEIDENILEPESKNRHHVVRRLTGWLLSTWGVSLEEIPVVVEGHFEVHWSLVFPQPGECDPPHLVLQVHGYFSTAFWQGNIPADAEFLDLFLLL